MRFALSSLLSLGIAFFLATAATDQPNAGKQSAVNIPALIDKLVEVADSDIGYSATVTGDAFLPVDPSGQLQMAQLSEKPHIPSESMREIVKQGAAAVPHLIAHLGDQRKTKIIVRHDDGLGTFYGDEFDYNIRTTKPLAVLARQEDEEDKEEEDELTKLLGPLANEPHTITVGDLCFVALGQIVNRHFNAVRYQPTGLTILSSPTHSPALLAAVKQEWGKLTPERHRASLIADLLKPDSEARRNGACKRLGYYYPDALEALVVPFLAQPTYDDSAYDVRSFVRETLYGTKDARKRRELLDAYMTKEGPGARNGILQQLFDDLRILEGYEAMRIWPLLNGYGRKPRELLIELFGYDKKVHSSQWPPPRSGIPASEKARLIDEGLIYDHSAKIDAAVRDLLRSTQKDDYLALACMRRLVGRGYDADIERYCRRRLPQLEERGRKELQQMLDRLGWKLVHVAVERQDREGLRSLIAEGADLQAKARNGMTPLHLAAAAGDKASLQLLIDAKIALDPKNARGETPVQLAARADHDEIVRFLVQKGCAVSDVLTASISGQKDRLIALLAQDEARIHTTTARKRTPLHLAARWGHSSLAKLLIDKGAAVDATDEDGWTPLHVAIAWKQESAARVLLDHKADVEARSPDQGSRLLHLAVQSGDAKLVELLLEAGADIEAKDEKRRTPLHVAAQLGKTEVARVLLKLKAEVTARVRRSDEYEGNQPLHFAAAAGRVPVMEILLAHKADLRAVNRYDHMPLHLAAEAGHIEAARWLLRHGADVNGCADLPFTPLYYAARAGQTEMVRFLLENKAVIPDAPPNGWGLLPVAAAYGNRETVRALLERKPDFGAREKQEALRCAIESKDAALIGLLADFGASVDVADENGETALYRFVRDGNLRMARVLLDHKANVRAALKDTGAEPLHEAAGNRSAKMVALLLDRGADVNAQQKSDGCTPLHIAIDSDDDRYSRLAVIALLLERKADCTIKNKDGLTPLALAIERERAEVIQLLRKHGAKE